MSIREASGIKFCSTPADLVGFEAKLPLDDLIYIESVGKWVRWDVGIGGWKETGGLAVNPTTGALEASRPIAVVYDGIAMRQNTLIYSPSARVQSSYNLTTEGNIFTYTIPASLALEFRNGYRIIRDRLMLGINRGDLVGNLLMKQYWNNVLVSSLVISASVNGWSGTPVANQNKVLDVINEVSNDNSVANQNLNDGMSYLRSHWEWKTMYTGTTPFGLMGETMYGATKFDLNSDIAVRWTAQWSGGPGSLYVDTIEVTF